jgi:hypothetical protein
MAAITTNHRIMTGPNSLPTLAGPRFWMRNNSTSTTSVTGTTSALSFGSNSSRPSTALRTEIAGVISASQKKKAVPASASTTTTVVHALPATRRRWASANSARIPPSPSLSARIMIVTYLMVTDRVSAQKISDRTPSTTSASNLPASLIAPDIA